MFFKICSTIILFCFLFTVVFAEAQVPTTAKPDEKGRPRIAVLPFADTNAAAKNEGYGEAISSMLMTELINGKVFQVIERNQIDRMMQEMAFQYSGAVDSKTAKRIGDVLGVEILVFGTVAKFAPVVETDIRLIDTESGEALLAENASSESGMEIRNMVESLARKIESRYLGRLIEDVAITSDPSNAAIFIDGLATGETPLSKSMSQGQHKVRITKANYQAWEQTITIISGKNNIAAKLIPGTVAQPKPTDVTRENVTDQQPSKGGSKAWLYVLGAAAIGGGAAAVLLSKKKSETASTTSQVTINVTIP
jgi:TolB-like protein